MSEKESNFFQGLLIGGILGAVFGIIFSTDQGRQFGSNIKDKLKEMDIDQMVDRVKIAFEAGRKEMEAIKKEDEQ